MKTKIFSIIFFGFYVLVNISNVRASNCNPDHISVNNTSGEQTSICIWDKADEDMQITLDLADSLKWVSVACGFKPALKSNNFVNVLIKSDNETIMNNPSKNIYFAGLDGKHSTLSFTLIKTPIDVIWEQLGYPIQYVPGDMETCTFSGSDI